MTVKELSEHQAFSVIAMPQPEREIKNVYMGDLLSWVMGKAQEDDAWITIMSNVNVIAVASLSDTACVILSEGVKLEDDIKQTAEAKGINVLTTEKSSFEAAVILSGII